MFTENVYKGTLIQNYNQGQEHFSMPIWRQTHTFKVYNIQQMNKKTNGKLKQYHHKIYLPYPAIREMSFQDIQKLDNIYSGCLKLSIFYLAKCTVKWLIPGRILFSLLHVLVSLLAPKFKNPAWSEWARDYRPTYSYDILRQDLDLKSHLKNWRSGGLNMWPLDW